VPSTHDTSSHSPLEPPVPAPGSDFASGFFLVSGFGSALATVVSRFGVGGVVPTFGFGLGCFGLSTGFGSTGLVSPVLPFVASGF
jgi:hypothetical protein